MRLVDPKTGFLKVLENVDLAEFIVPGKLVMRDVMISGSCEIFDKPRSVCPEQAELRKAKEICHRANQS